MVTNKHNIKLKESTFNSNVDRLTNQIWKLIPMRENGEDWEFHLENVILELVGLHNTIIDVDFLQLVSKLEGLKERNAEFDIYRKNVFESISLLRGVKIAKKK